MIILPGDVVTLPTGDAVVTRVTTVPPPVEFAPLWTRFDRELARLAMTPLAPSPAPRDPRGVATVTHTTNRAARRAAQKAQR